MIVQVFLNGKELIKQVVLSDKSTDLSPMSPIGGTYLIEEAPTSRPLIRNSPEKLLFRPQRMERRVVFPAPLRFMSPIEPTWLPELLSFHQW